MNFDLRQAVLGLVKLLLVCLLVGYLLSVFNVDPLGFLRFLSGTLRHAADLAAEAARWATPYVLLGAVVVVPFYLIRYGLGLLRRRRGR